MKSRNIIPEIKVSMGICNACVHISLNHLKFVILSLCGMYYIEKDGFGHIAFNTDDVYAACDKLEKAGVTFKKRPDEGRMKGLAFAYDPDGYWVEIVKRSEANKIANYFNFSQTMLRIKDPTKSIPFYEAFGMTVVRQKNYGDFSNFFLASSPNVDTSIDYSSLSDDEAKARLSMMFGPVSSLVCYFVLYMFWYMFLIISVHFDTRTIKILELTHNHGTENDGDFKHYNGNEEGREGFGHIGFLVDDVYAACDKIREMGYGFRKEPDGGSMKGLAFAYDPDGYSIEIIKRGGIEFGDKKE